MLQFFDWKPVRQVSADGILGDIISHLPAGNVYEEKDLVTSAHECTHGINSNIRMGHTGYNGFYCLQNRAILIKEPPISIREVAAAVPKELIAHIFQLYMVEAAASWNNSPLYICDEWSGYLNGSSAGIDLAKRGKWNGGQRNDTVGFMLEMTSYAYTLYDILKGKSYEDSQFFAFLDFQLSRTMVQYKSSKGLADFESGDHDVYFDKMKNSRLGKYFKTVPEPSNHLTYGSDTYL